MKILLALICFSAGPAAAAAADREFSSAVNYDTGKYGSKTRTDSVYIPFTFKLYLGDADLSVTVPYLRQSSTGLVTRVGGKPVRVSRGEANVGSSAEAGIGDITVRGAYTLKVDGPESFDLALAGGLKLPTASKARGLGTGEPDESAGLEFAKEVRPGWTFLADGYYTIVGNPPGADFNDLVSADMGFYTALRKNLGLTVLYEGQSALVRGNAAPRSLSGTLSYSAAEGLQFAGGLTLGLSEGSPAIGIGAALNKKF